MENKKLIGLLIEDDERGLDRAITVAQAQGLDKVWPRYLDKNIIWTWVTNFEDFKKYIIEKGLPDVFGFDHDLGGNSYQLYHKHGGYKEGQINYDEYDEPTGFHCVKWLTEYCQDNKILLTGEVLSHSMNPQGRNNIISIFNNLKNFQEEYGIETDL